jgi:hypothetical protein
MMSSSRQPSEEACCQRRTCSSRLYQSQTSFLPQQKANLIQRNEPSDASA